MIARQLQQDWFFQNEWLKRTISKSHGKNLRYLLGTFNVKMAHRAENPCQESQIWIHIRLQQKRRKQAVFWFILHTAIYIPYLWQMFNSVPFSTLS